ncbi:MAG: hypothetical protein F4W89_03540 [Acidobacteria bacterium]|nr:hypothetical protein [Acidobacteriota bacterium]
MERATLATNGPFWRIGLPWFLASLPAAPLAVLPHEAGHYVVYWLLDVPDLRFYPMAVGWTNIPFRTAIATGDLAAAAAIAPIRAVALAHLAGPVVTYLVVALCCWACAWWKPLPVFVAIAYLSQVRVVAGVRHIADELLGRPIPDNRVFDELQFSHLTGVPVEWPIGFGVAILAVSGTWLLRFFPSGQRAIAIPAMMAGLVTGAMLYAGVLAPWLSP